MRKAGPGHYDDVEESCRALGGRMAHTRQPRDVDAVATVAGGEAVWIGLTHNIDNEWWVWADKQVQPDFWAHRWPAGYPRAVSSVSTANAYSCVTLRNLSGVSGWVNHECSHSFYGMCAAPDHCRDAEAARGEPWCLNGGVCTSDPLAGAMCKCPQGFKGERCQRDCNAKTVITTPRGKQWVPLLLGAWYDGLHPNTVGFQPRLPGGVATTVTQLRFETRSGWVANADPHADDWYDYPWDISEGQFPEETGPHWTGQPELYLNGQFIVEAPSAFEPAPNCPTTPQAQNQKPGQFICDVSITLQPGDVLTPTFYEPSHNDQWLADNRGRHYIDVWGYAEPAAGASVSLNLVHSMDVDAAAGGYGCVTTCDAEFAVVIETTAQCNDDGTWTGPQPRCLGTLHPLPQATRRALPPVRHR